MPSFECTAVDCPARHTVSVVNLLQRDAGGNDDRLHPGGVLNGNRRIEVKRLDEDVATPVCQSRAYEGVRILSGQQPSLETNSAG